MGLGAQESSINFFFLRSKIGPLLCMQGDRLLFEQGGLVSVKPKLSKSISINGGYA